MATLIKIKSIYKDPNEVADYSFYWSEWLGTDTISASTWDVPDPLTQPYSDTFTTTDTHVWLAGGVAGQIYRVTNHITTANNRQQDATFIITVQDDY